MAAHGSSCLSHASHCGMLWLTTARPPKGTSFGDLQASAVASNVRPAFCCAVAMSKGWNRFSRSPPHPQRSQRATAADLGDEMGACSAPVVTSSRATPQFRHSANLSWSHQGCAAAVASWGIHPRWTGTWGRVCTAVPMPADCSVPPNAF